MSEPYQLSLRQFDEQCRYVQWLNSMPRPDRSTIGLYMESLVAITDTFPACERARFLVELHKMVYIECILDYTWGPKVELAIISRLLMIADPQDGRPIEALVHPITLAFMHERYAYIMGDLFHQASHDEVFAHRDRAAQLRNPRRYWLRQKTKQYATWAAINGSSYLIERRRARRQR